MQKVINFSGGKTSAYMTIENYKHGDIVIFCDTGREHPKTYKFINDFEAFEKIPITRVSYYGSKNAFQEMLAKRNYKIIPHRMRRFCTVELKVKTCKRYLRNIGIQRFEQLIGFRADEPRRVENSVEKYKKVKTSYPLYNSGITKQDIEAYWQKKSYTLEIPHILGNCTLCFMKGKNAIMAILREFPELADPWISDEENAAKHKDKRTKSGGRTYLPGTTIRQLRDEAQHNLFKDYDLNEITPAFNCACTT